MPTKATQEVLCQQDTPYPRRPCSRTVPVELSRRPHRRDGTRAHPWPESRDPSLVARQREARASR